jgi:hypothetical protein
MISDEQLLNLTPEQRQALHDLVWAARSIDADLSCNYDRRGLNDNWCMIEAVRIRNLLDALSRFDEGKCGGTFLFRENAENG